MVESGSFTKAAHTLHMSRTTVTQLVQQIEARLRKKLLHRTTSSVQLTADGAAYYPRVVRLLDVRTQQMGPQELLVGVELELDARLSGVELTVALDEIENAVRAAVPEARQIYMEPHTPE